ncbi:MAG: DUF5103 domain-containing protein [Bacteroidales bacterium]|jgi:hypothetical protein|nr:DUF5103 domain-containing protein [Bacteroidales bacterium]
MKNIIAIIFITLVINTVAQPTDFSNIVMENRIYHEDIISMKVDNPEMNFSLPIITLNSSEYLRLTFDDIGEQSKYLKYTFIHCTYDWKPTENFRPIDYMSKFAEGDIVDYQTSVTTMQYYANYWLDFPNNDVGVNKSGNYILYVYEDNNGEYIPVLTHRFCMVEKLVNITPNIQQSSNIATRYTKQEVSFQVEMSRFKVNNASRNLKVVVSQNARTDNAYIASTPQSVAADVLRFGRPDEIVFEGGSEFRVFNIRSLRSTMEHISRHAFGDGQNHTYVYVDNERVHLAYEDRMDINGCYFIAADDGFSLQHADYTNVYFSLQCMPPKDADIYIYGELTNWTLSPQYKLDYHQYRKQWEVALYLKTGYYNYTYIALPKGKTEGTFMYTEGSFWQTENRYTFLAYYNGDGLQYDRIIGYTQTCSFEKEGQQKKLFDFKWHD